MQIQLSTKKITSHAKTEIKNEVSITTRLRHKTDVELSKQGFNIFMISILRVPNGGKYNIQDPVAALNKDTEAMRESKENDGEEK